MDVPSANGIAPVTEYYFTLRESGPAFIFFTLSAHLNARAHGRTRGTFVTNVCAITETGFPAGRRNIVIKL